MCKTLLASPRKKLLPRPPFLPFSLIIARGVHAGLGVGEAGALAREVTEQRYPSLGHSIYMSSSLHFFRCHYPVMMVLRRQPTT